MPKFFSAYDTPQTVACSSGDTDYIDYVEKIDKSTGRSMLLESSRKNIREYVLASFESTKLENLLVRFANGDINALNRVQGFYDDISSMPTSLVEAHEMLQNAKNEFSSLPLEIREKFGNDVNQFIAGFSNGKIAELLRKDDDIDESKSGIEVQSDTSSEHIEK